MENNKKVKGGLFISFEGIEGSGKSTQAKILSTKLKADGYDVLATREPGGTPVGDELRHLVQHVCGKDAVCDEAELLIFCASRAQLMKKRILPHLEQGGIVICDRFIDSTTAYQGYGRGIDLDFILNLHHYTVSNRLPDITILLDVEVATGLKRIKLRSQSQPIPDRIEQELPSFHQRVRQGFLECAEQFGNRFRLIYAEQDEVVIHKKIIAIVYRVIETL